MLCKTKIRKSKIIRTFIEENQERKVEICKIE